MDKLIPIKTINIYKGVDLSDRLEEFQSIDLTINKNIKKILIIKWGGMGDLVMASGIMEDIAQAFPDSDIDLNTRPQWAPLFDNDKRFYKVWGSNNKALNAFVHAFKWIKKVTILNYSSAIL